MDNLARFYTEKVVSDLLIQEMSFLDPKLIIDLGIGSGSLTNSAFKKWKNATFLAADIDILQIKTIRENFPQVRVIIANGLHSNIHKKLNVKIGTVDVAICNPPYIKIKSKQAKYINLLNNVGLTNCKYLKYLTSDLIFLAQNLLLLKDGGELGIILPDGLLSSKEFIIFRQDLVKCHTITSIIQLPDRIFKKTEARTHILIIKKSISSKSKTANLFLSDIDGKYIDNTSVPLTALIERMDFSFHKLNQKSSEYQKSTLTLGAIGAEIRRGQLTHSILKTTYTNYIHTTTLIHSSEIKLINEIRSDQNNFLYTDKNDILLARVGRGCIGKVSLVKGGNQLISDCVYRIRVPKKYLKFVWNSIRSSEGQLWLNSYSRGICARLISKSDLLNFPFITY